MTRNCPPMRKTDGAHSQQSEGKYHSTGQEQVNQNSLKGYSLLRSTLLRHSRHLLLQVLRTGKRRWHTSTPECGPLDFIPQGVSHSSILYTESDETDIL
mmetsp:Transcript_5867/g.16741  ORF Transcript_5867/g.16741 Transcript_5867/m.16741 type:complete len:99 (-) Transcript_5867:636-932(-)